MRELKQINQEWFDVFESTLKNKSKRKKRKSDLHKYMAEINTLPKFPMTVPDDLYDYIKIDFPKHNRKQKNKDKFTKDTSETVKKETDRDPWFKDVKHMADLLRTNILAFNRLEKYVTRVLLTRNSSESLAYSKTKKSHSNLFQSKINIGQPMQFCHLAQQAVIKPTVNICKPPVVVESGSLRKSSLVRVPNEINNPKLSLITVPSKQTNLVPVLHHKQTANHVKLMELKRSVSLQCIDDSKQTKQKQLQIIQKRECSRKLIPVTKLNSPKSQPLMTKVRETLLDDIRKNKNAVSNDVLLSHKLASSIKLPQILDQATKKNISSNLTMVNNNLKNCENSSKILTGQQRNNSIKPNKLMVDDTAKSIKASKIREQADNNKNVCSNAELLTADLANSLQKQLKECTTILEQKFNKTKGSDKINVDDIKQRANILEINQKVFDGIEKEISTIKIIDKVKTNVKDLPHEENLHNKIKPNPTETQEKFKMEEKHNTKFDTNLVATPLPSILDEITQIRTLEMENQLDKKAIQNITVISENLKELQIIQKTKITPLPMDTISINADLHKFKNVLGKAPAEILSSSECPLKNVTDIKTDIFANDIKCSRVNVVTKQKVVPECTEPCTFIPVREEQQTAALCCLCPETNHDIMNDNKTANTENMNQKTLSLATSMSVIKETMVNIKLNQVKEATEDQNDKQQVSELNEININHSMHEEAETTILDAQERQPGGIHLYNRLPLHFKKNRDATTLPISSFWNTHPRLPVSCKYFEKQPKSKFFNKRYRYEAKEVKSATGEKIKITIMVPDD